MSDCAPSASTTFATLLLTRGAHPKHYRHRPSTPTLSSSSTCRTMSPEPSKTSKLPGCSTLGSKSDTALLRNLIFALQVFYVLPANRRKSGEGGIRTHETG